MMRYMRHNHRTTLGTSHVAIDCESIVEIVKGRKNTVIHSFRCGHAIFWRMEKGKQTRRCDITFREQEHFWDWLRTRMADDKPVNVWAHHMSYELTLLKFWERLAAGEYSVLEPDWRYLKRLAVKDTAIKRRGLIVTEDPPIIVKVWHRSGSQVCFLDTLNFWRGGMREMYEAFCIQYPNMPDETAGEYKWAIKAASDAGVVEMAVMELLRFIKDNDLGNLRYTAPSQSLAAYRHRFMDYPICVHDVPDVRRVERSAYFGGECEAYFVGQINNVVSKYVNSGSFGLVNPRIETNQSICHVDCNSMYPFVMKWNLFPCKLLAVQVGPTSSEIARVIKRCGVVAHVRVKTASDRVYKRTDKEIIPAVGSFDTYLCGPEFVRHWSAGNISRVHTMCVYETQPLFTRFVDEFHRLRVSMIESGRSMQANLCKLLMCSLYGKFAQRQPQWEDTGEMSENDYGYEYLQDDDDKEATQVFRSVGRNLQKMLARDEKETSFIAISAFVTSYGREYMRSVRLSLPEKSVFYQGVDSLIITRAAYDALVGMGKVHKTELGKFKLKGVHDSAEIKGSNYYILDGDATRAGLSEKAVLGVDGKYRQIKTRSLDTMIARNELGYVSGVEETMPVEQAFTRGIINSDGWVKPLKIDE